MRSQLALAMLTLAAAALIPVSAQQPAAITTADCARAEKFLSANVAPLVVGGAMAPKEYLMQQSTGR